MSMLQATSYWGSSPSRRVRGGALPEFYSQLKPHLPSDWALRAGYELPALLPSAKQMRLAFLDFGAVVLSGPQTRRLLCLRER
jgi:hypothetical protein